MNNNETCLNCDKVFEVPKYCCDKCEEESNMKYREVPNDILPPVEKVSARNEFPCEAKCGYIIQKNGNYWRVTDEGGVNPMCVCFKCKETKVI